MRSTLIRWLLAALLGLLLLPAAAHGQATDALIGLWSTEIRHPSLKGELTIRRSGRVWHGSIAGAEADGAVRDGEIRIAFPDGRGAFRGRLASDRRTLTGFWLQPPAGEGDRNDPGGFGQPFAGPLALSRVTADRWRGQVVPLEGRFTLYLKIFRGPDGALLGAFRNPETNSNGGAQQFRVTRTGDAVRFNVKYDGGEISHDAAFLPSPDRIRIAWPDLGRTLELVRRSPETARSFFPRMPGEPPYAYRRPTAGSDGWDVARARDVGIDEAALTRAVQGIATGDPAGRPANLIHSLLVARHGKLVLEEYFFGYDSGTPHDTRSAGKTFASVLMGTERLRGTPIDPEMRAYDLLRGMGPFANPDPRKPLVTLAHLMTHSSGLACDDNDEASPGNEETMQSQKAQPDWWKYTLDLPMAHDPGARYAYCSANMNLVGAALTTAGRTWLPAMFERDVARPLQFGRWYWNLMPTGEGYLGGGAFLRPRDLLKIGQAYLGGGVWKGRRIVDAAWVRASTTPRIEVTPATTGLSEEEFANFYGAGADALAWHMAPITVGGRRYEGYQASGNGGQLLIVYPELDMTIVFTGGNYRQGGIWGRWAQQIVGDIIAPTLRD